MDHDYDVDDEVHHSREHVGRILILVCPPSGLPLNAAPRQQNVYSNFNSKQSDVSVDVNLQRNVYLGDFAFSRKENCHIFDV